MRHSRGEAWSASCDTNGSYIHYDGTNTSFFFYGSSCTIAQSAGSYRRYVTASKATQNSRTSTSNCFSLDHDDEPRHANF
jgi:hypothetical protein